MHSSINIPLESNHEEPVDLYRKYWHALQQNEDYENLPIGEEISIDTLTAAKMAFNDLNLFYPPDSKSEAKFSGSCLKISSMLNGKNASVLSTLLSPAQLVQGADTKGKSFLISKSSLVGENPFADLGRGKMEKARIVARDEAADLVLLELETVLKDGIVLAAAPPDTLVVGDLGKFLVSPQPGADAIRSVIGTTRFDLPMKYRAGYSGAGIVMKDGKVVLNIVQDTSAARAAQLKVGDEILKRCCYHVPGSLYYRNAKKQTRRCRDGGSF